MGEILAEADCRAEQTVKFGANHSVWKLGDKNILRRFNPAPFHIQTSIIHGVIFIFIFIFKYGDIFHNFVVIIINSWLF